MTEESPVPTATILGRGLLGRCPRCGKGKLFTGYLKVADACRACGLSLTEHDAADGPAVFGIFIVGGFVVGLALLLEIWYAPPLWVHAALWTPLIMICCLAILKPTKGLTIALQYKFRSTEKPLDDGKW